MKKLTAVAFVVLALGLAACGGSSDAGEPSAATTTEAAPQGPTVQEASRAFLAFADRFNPEIGAVNEDLRSLPDDASPARVNAVLERYHATIERARSALLEMAWPESVQRQADDLQTALAQEAAAVRAGIDQGAYGGIGPAQAQRAARGDALRLALGLEPRNS